MNMSWENFMMDLMSIPRYDLDDDNEDKKEKEEQPTSSVDIMDLFK